MTTVPSRRDDLLPQTLASLRNAGFDRPRLFVDGGGSTTKTAKGSASWEEEFGLDVTYRGGDPVRTAGNWVLTLYELYARDPNATYYAVFQDDLLAPKNLRQYLEARPVPDGGYGNLYTFPSNQKFCQDGFTGWYEARPINTKNSPTGPDGKPYQGGKGAVGLVVPNPVAVELLSSRYLVERFKDVSRGHKAIDGGIVSALNRAGVREFVHNPSLLQHTGDRSAMGNRPHEKAESFPGEHFDLTELLNSASGSSPTT